MPEAVIPSFGARSWTSSPVSKMSKPVESERVGPVPRRPRPHQPKFKREVTDSEHEVRYDPTADLRVTNLLEILSSATGQKPDDLAKDYTQYGLLRPTPATR